MKIAEICPYDLGTPGGVQTQVRQLATELRQRGHEVAVVGPGAPGWEWLGPIVRVPSNDAVAPVAVGARVWRRLGEALEDFDALHVHEPLMPMVGPAAARSSVPALGTLHADPSHWIRLILAAGWGGRTRRRVAMLTAVSPVARSALARQEVEIIPNGVDTRLFRPSPRRSGRVLFVGRDEPRKGLDVLMAAWPSVQARVAGAGLSVVSDRSTGPPGIEWLGQVDDTERTGLMRSAEVVCAPNLRGESFGMVVAEGLAAGCGIVASGLPAFRWVAGDSADFVPPGDTAALADALVARLRAPADPEAQRARAARFRWDVVADRYEHALSMIC